MMFGDPTYLLLATLALPVVAGFTCLFVVMFRASAQAQRDLDEASPPAKNCRDTLGPLSISDAHDPERNILWDNQIIALQLIGTGTAIPELLALWKRYVHLYPELYEQTSFWDWLTFLQNCGLVEATGNVLRLTSNGREFLNLLICNSHALRENGHGCQ